MFMSLVDLRTDIFLIQNLYYLKSSMEGEAAKVLASVKMCAANYNSAWEKLRKLDSFTRQAWTLTQDASVYPTFKELDEFLSHLVGSRSQGVSPEPKRGVIRAHQLVETVLLSLSF
ncbi:hypothetical protein KM043_012385 [Ampulex compressa]|nr:hypothetical protein KM043_012385 [Ampulex compressa]